MCIKIVCAVCDECCVEHGWAAELSAAMKAAVIVRPRDGSAPHNPFADLLQAHTERHATPCFWITLDDANYALCATHLRRWLTRLESVASCLDPLPA